MKRILLMALLLGVGFLLCACAKEEEAKPALMFNQTLYYLSDAPISETSEGFTKVGAIKSRGDADKMPKENEETNLEIAEGEMIYIQNDDYSTLYVYSGKWLRFDQEPEEQDAAK